MKARPVRTPSALSPIFSHSEITAPQVIPRAASPPTTASSQSVAVTRRPLAKTTFASHNAAIVWKKAPIVSRSFSVLSDSSLLRSSSCSDVQTFRENGSGCTYSLFQMQTSVRASELSQAVRQSSTFVPQLILG